MTLKSKEHVMYLWQDIYKLICSNTAPHPWPNPQTGKPISQYHFSTSEKFFFSLASLTEIHKQWYVSSKK